MGPISEPKRWRILRLYHQQILQSADRSRSDPNGDGDLSDAEIAGAVTLVADSRVPKDDKISSLAGFGGQGIVALPNVYNGWVQNLNSQWSAGLTDQQRNPVQ